ncbi:MAG: aminotransferase class IV [Candidatus Uhrbacteria bacterium]|nr:aminotransferase class IV [Candidatus Uhrbacteria bacterium]
MPLEKARISLSDLGLVRGYAVWEYLATYNGKPFKFEKHFARLARSAKNLDIKLPITEASALAQAKKLVSKNRISGDGSIKLVLTGGHSPNGISRQSNASTFYILAYPRERYPESYYQKGSKVITCDFQRQFANSKTTSYIMAVRLQKLQQQKKAIEILYTNNGQISECTRSNFFICKGNTIITPREGILAGVTRELALQLAKGKFKIEERPLRLAELKTASEAFLTSTDREIMPVVKVDSLRIGNGKVGPVTKQLIAAFREYVAQY